MSPRLLAVALLSLSGCATPDPTPSASRIPPSPEPLRSTSDRVLDAPPGSAPHVPVDAPPGSAPHVPVDAPPGSAAHVPVDAAPGSAANVPVDAGVLVVAHGGSAGWNALIEELVSHTRPRLRVAVGFLSHDYGPSVQEAYDALVAAGARQVVAVPLLVSSQSGHAREVAEMLGHGDPHHPVAHDDDHPPIDVLPEFAPVVTVTPALDDHPLVAAVLRDRCRELTEDAHRETVVLVAHGPNGEQDAARWLENLQRLAAPLADEFGFRAVVPCLLRDDAPEPVREAATRHLREVVARGADDGRALVVPVLLSQGYVLWQIPKLLEGLAYGWSGRALLPDARLAEWIVQSVDRHFEQHGSTLTGPL